MTPNPAQSIQDFANVIAQRKPHLIEIEQRIADLEYGEMEVVLVIRAGVVEKMEFINRKTWLRDKKLDNAQPNVLNSK